MQFLANLSEIFSPLREGFWKKTRRGQQDVAEIETKRRRRTDPESPTALAPNNSVLYCTKSEDGVSIPNKPPVHKHNLELRKGKENELASKLTAEYSNSSIRHATLSDNALRPAQHQNHFQPSSVIASEKDIGNVTLRTTLSNLKSASGISANQYSTQPQHIGNLAAPDRPLLDPGPSKQQATRQTETPSLSHPGPSLPKILPRPLYQGLTSRLYTPSPSNTARSMQAYQPYYSNPRLSSRKNLGVDEYRLMLVDAGTRLKDHGAQIYQMAKQSASPREVIDLSVEHTVLDKEMEQFRGFKTDLEGIRAREADMMSAAISRKSRYDLDNAKQREKVLLEDHARAAAMQRSRALVSHAAAQSEALRAHEHTQHANLIAASLRHHARSIPAPAAAAAAATQKQLNVPVVPAVPSKAKPSVPSHHDEENDVVELLSSEGEEEAGEYEEEGEEEEGSWAEDEEEAEEGIVKGIEKVTLRGLTPREQEVWEHVMKRGSKEEVILSHKGASVDLSRAKLQCMQDGVWLNDEVINLYMFLLQERDTRLRERGTAPRCHFFNSFFLSKLFMDSGKYNYKDVRRWTMPVKLKNCAHTSLMEVDRVIVPVNLNNVHWTCAMIDIKGKRFVYYDSMGAKESVILENLAQYLADEYQDKKKVVLDTSSWKREYEKNCPRQTNGCDCGVFTIMTAHYLSLNKPFDYTQKDMWLMRRRVLACLFDKQIPA